ncbi:MAG: transglutaminase-like domain-containing protein [Bacteroidia bacterium]|nr:transglutaminase-like domain-containing protein [Bacteroidia bacterium]
MNETEIKALLSLLEDPDEKISSQISEKILSLGIEVIPKLELHWESTFDAFVQKKIETLIHQIQFDNIVKALSIWSTIGTQDLLQGAILIAKYQYPDLNEDKIKTHLDLIRQDTWLELNPRLTVLEKIKVLNHILFEIHGFGGNTTNYHSPTNSYINNVLETKKGNPLSLSIIYCIIAQSLDIPIFGVNLPEHFIVCYQDLKHEIPTSLINSNRIYFYINPFSKGSIFGQNDIDTFLKQINRTPEKQFYEPCSNLDIMIRLLNNLILSYEKLGIVEKVRELKILQKTIQSGSN